MSHHPRVPLSVLDLAPISTGSDVRQALANTVDLARRVEQAGYRRYWLAEHHLSDGLASSATPVLIGQVAAATSRLRVGSGATLLGYHTPLAVAEAYGTLDALHPGASTWAWAADWRRAGGRRPPVPRRPSRRPDPGR